ncbi:MAG: hypothetical protein ACLFSQ_07655 [Candidatus Zixiibacteriota bacterium]
MALKEVINSLVLFGDVSNLVFVIPLEGQKYTTDVFSFTWIGIKR